MAKRKSPLNALETYSKFPEGFTYAFNSDEMKALLKMIPNSSVIVHHTDGNCQCGAKETCLIKKKKEKK